MGRAAAQVDVAAIGLVTHHQRFEAQIAEQPGRHRRRGAVGAIDHQLESTGHGHAGEHHLQMTEIGRDEVGALDRHGITAGGLPAAVGDDLFDPALDGLRELFTASREHLDAVVFERIVRRRDDDTGVVSGFASQVGHRRRGHDANAGDRRPLARGAVGELGFNPITRFARVTSDQEALGSHRRAAALVPAPRRDGAR